MLVMLWRASVRSDTDRVSMNTAQLHGQQSSYALPTSPDTGRVFAVSADYLASAIVIVRLSGERSYGSTERAAGTANMSLHRNTSDAKINASTAENGRCALRRLGSA